MTCACGGDAFVGHEIEVAACFPTDGRDASGSCGLPRLRRGPRDRTPLQSAGRMIGEPLASCVCRWRTLTVAQIRCPSGWTPAGEQGNHDHPTAFSMCPGCPSFGSRSR